MYGPIEIESPYFLGDIRELVFGGCKIQLYSTSFNLLAQLAYLTCCCEGDVFCDQKFPSLVYAEDQIRYSLYQSGWPNVWKSFELYF